MAQVGSGDYPSLHSASGEGTMGSGEPSTAAGVGEAFWTSSVEAESTYVKHRTSRTQRSAKNEDREQTEAASHGGAMAGSLGLADAAF